LTKLDEQPVHAASRYVYDWLVALYTLANENAGYRHPQDVTDVFLAVEAGRIDG
ncbi:hypothetical protein MJI95_37730, partial [Salmonella enterica subsp. enterica serovar Kentucky]|nr:hypothetical protein [Salmonella enterica subsp. enterica serovar Kentucky]